MPVSHNLPYVFFCYPPAGSIVTGVQSVNTTAFERRFHLNSVQVGWITTCIHISAVTVGTTISFLGAKK